MSDTGEVLQGYGAQDIPRETLIATAVTFLNNKDVQRHPIGQKQQFLRSKGLSENEIQMACERAGVFSNDPVNIPRTDGSASLYAPVPYLKRTSRFQRFREMLNSIAALSGLAYCAYVFYKRFIKPWLFGSPTPAVKPKTVDESLRELESVMERRLDQLNAELGRVREEINRNSLKSDLDAIKGLLLNKKQFANPIVPPSIPAWQLASSQLSVVDESGHSRNNNDDDKDNDTGSGSSETEIVTKNSDSSLEIM